MIKEISTYICNDCGRIMELVSDSNFVINHCVYCGSERDTVGGGLSYDSTTTVDTKTYTVEELLFAEVFEDTEDYREVELTDEEMTYALESCLDTRNKDEIETELNRRLIKIGFQYNEDEYKWFR